MPFNFAEPVEFAFKVVLDPDGTIHSRYCSSPRFALLFPNTYERGTNMIEYLCEPIITDYANLDESPKKFGGLICK